MIFRSHLSRLVFGGVVAVGAVTLAAAPVGAGTTGTLTVTATNFAFALSDTTLDAGKYELTFTNASGGTPHEFVAFKLVDRGTPYSNQDLLDAANSDNDSIVDKFAGFAFAPAGGTDTGKLKLKDPGQYAYFCFIGSPGASAHYNLGMVGTFTVT